MYDFYFRPLFSYISKFRIAKKEKGGGIKLFIGNKPYVAWLFLT